MRQHAVILTYPGHFLLTGLTIQSVKEYFPEVNDITVLADDISDRSWSTYVQDCERFYQCSIIALSKFDRFRKFRGNPWIRQQIVKLYLDEVLPFQEWFFVDGDVIFYFGIDQNVVPYTLVPYSGVPLSERDPGPGETTSQQLYYVQHLLGIETDGIWHEGPEGYKRVCASGAPFRDMQAQTLKDLRSYVEQRFSKSFDDIHLALANDTRHSVSEWELIETFRLKIQHKQLDLRFYPPYNVLDILPPKEYVRPLPFFKTCYCSDTELGEQWWNQQALSIPNNIWSILPKKK